MQSQSEKKNKQTKHENYEGISFWFFGLFAGSLTVNNYLFLRIFFFVVVLVFFYRVISIQVKKVRLGPKNSS